VEEDAIMLQGSLAQILAASFSTRLLDFLFLGSWLIDLFVGPIRNLALANPIINCFFLSYSRFNTTQ
jgi:hypothetical protein